MERLERKRRLRLKWLPRLPMSTDSESDARIIRAHSEPSPARTVRAVRRGVPPFAAILPGRILATDRRATSLRFLPRDFLPLPFAPARFPLHKPRVHSSRRDTPQLP